MPSESYIDSVTTFFEIEMYSKFWSFNLQHFWGWGRLMAGRI